MKAQRYELIAGEEIWIVDRVDLARNPMFRLGPRDMNHARALHRNLNAIRRAADAFESNGSRSRRRGERQRTTHELLEEGGEVS